MAVTISATDLLGGKEKLKQKFIADEAATRAQETAKTEATKREDLSNKYLASVQQEADVAAGAAGRLEQASQEAQAATRANTGKVLANTRGMLGGGRGLAVMRGAALDRGAQEGAQRAQYAGQIQSAMQDAARAKSEALSEQGKALQAKELESKNIQIASKTAEDDARAMADDFVGWLSDSNRQEIATALRAKGALQTTPGEQQAYMDMATQVEQGKELGKVG